MNDMIIDYIADFLDTNDISFVQSIQTTYKPFRIQDTPERYIFVHNAQTPIVCFMFYDDRIMVSCYMDEDNLEQLFDVDLRYSDFDYDLELIKREALLILLTSWIC